MGCRIKPLFRGLIAVIIIVMLLMIGVLSAKAEEGIELPKEYEDFIGILDGDTAQRVPEDALLGDAESVNGAASQMSSPQAILSAVLSAFSSGIEQALPRLTTVLAIVIISSLCYILSSYCGAGLSRAIEVCVRLCSFCAVSGVALSCAETLELYFSRLFEAVAAFIPLSAVMYAMGGNLTSAASASGTLGVILTLCQFVCTRTVLPVFCLCLCMSLISVFDGVSGSLGATVGATVRKWYTTAMAFLMMILTGALSSQSILASKADTAAMKGAKFAVSSFVPLFGGTLSGTLGTLASSVELLRGSVGIIGIIIIFLMLLPTAIELALMRAVFSVGAFCAGLVGCPSEQRIMNDIGSLYGYLEGVALMCSAVFIIAFGIFAASATPFS
ncbi:MAG: hypothetical protein E7649_06860 [Ruminococcaceae bacterium]|nr:hypothetical protein [Oscillospiraceae bacterium]